MRKLRALITFGGPILGAAFALLVGRGCADSQRMAMPVPTPNSAVQAVHADPAVTFQDKISPLLKTYCYECHGNGDHAGDVALDKYTTAAAVEQDPKVWQTVAHHVRSGQMPPAAAEKKPSAGERRLIANWVEQFINHFDPARPDPGRVTMRRLNRAEYNNTIRDIIGVDFQPAADFPPDDSGNHGFDNIGDVLSLPPILMQKYFAAAGKIMDQAIETEPVVSRNQRIPATLGETNHNSRGDRGDGWMELVSVDEDSVSIYVPISNPGDYTFRVRAFARPTGGLVQGTGGDMSLRLDAKGPIEPMRMTLLIDGITLKIVEPTTDEANPGTYEVRTSLGAGSHRVQAAVRRNRMPSDVVSIDNRYGTQQAGIVFVKWFEVEGPLPVSVRRFEASQLEAPADSVIMVDGNRQLTHNGEVGLPINVVNEGDYLFRIAAAGAYAGTEPTHMQVRMDGEAIKEVEVLGTGRMVIRPSMRPDNQFARPFIYEVQAHLKPGKHRLSTAFTNEFADPKNADVNVRVRTLVIHSVEVVALSEKILPNPMPTQLREMFARHGVLQPENDPSGDLSPRPVNVSVEVAARGILADFGRTTWRRPLQTGELDRLMGLFTLAQKEQATFAESIKLPMTAMLVSPNFLFIGNHRAPAAEGTADYQPVDELTLASRLSFFLWSSTPDEELLSLAERGQLRAHLESQVKRMLASPKSRALVDNFAGEWLEIRGLTGFTPDKDVYPNFNPTIQSAMQKETETFVEYIFRNNRSMTELLTADYTFVNDILAKFYGLPEVKGEEFQKVSLAGTPRRGILTQGSILIRTSNPTRTSPVKRGKWVLDNLLGMPPPPPPPGVPPLDDTGKQASGTLRQQMEQHRANPVCASCHATMDPIGFSLENFDGVGAWRDKEGLVPVNSTGELVSGESFSGASELIQILGTKQHDNFLGCVSEKILTYALGRGLEYYDRPTLDQMVAHLAKNGDSFNNVVMETVTSFPFQMTRTNRVESARTPTAPMEEKPHE